MNNSKIWLAVTCIHLVGIALLSTSSSPKPKPKRLVVITKQLKPPSVTVSTPAVSNPLVKAVVHPPPQKKPESPLKKPKPTPTKKPVKSSKQVLKKLDRRITKPYVPPPAPKSVLPTIDSLPSYIESTCSLFRELLVLPEKGLVKLTITVQANGKIGTVKVETFESKNNLDYLLTMLPTLSLPIPEGEKDATFTILFCNDHFTP